MQSVHACWSTSTTQACAEPGALHQLVNRESQRTHQLLIHLHCLLLGPAIQCNSLISWCWPVSCCAHLLDKRGDRQWQSKAEASPSASLRYQRSLARMAHKNDIDDAMSALPRTAARRANNERQAGTLCATERQCLVSEPSIRFESQWLPNALTRTPANAVCYFDGATSALQACSASRDGAAQDKRRIEADPQLIVATSPLRWCLTDILLKHHQHTLNFPSTFTSTLCASMRHLKAADRQLL